MVKKNVLITLAVLGFVGALAHVTSALGIFDLLGLFKSWAMWVQLIAGVSGGAYIILKGFK